MAHRAFDPIWQTGRMTRSEAYAWLSRRMGMGMEQCHIARMDDDQLRRVIELCCEVTAFPQPGETRA